jgi:hypothetical protein
VHANKQRALEKLTKILESMNKPTIELTYKQLRERIMIVLGEVLNPCTVSTWDKWPGSIYLADHITKELGNVLEFGKEKVRRGSRVVIIDGFSKGSRGTVEFVEPKGAALQTKVWVLRDGDSEPKYWFEQELEILTEK